MPDIEPNLDFCPLFVVYGTTCMSGATVQNEKELFNHRNSYLRVSLEQAFGSLKRRLIFL
jgi:hypothetical protein